jgi:hypothetical protein
MSVAPLENPFMQCGPAFAQRLTYSCSGFCREEINESAEELGSDYFWGEHDVSDVATAARGGAGSCDYV